MSYRKIVKVGAIVIPLTMLLIGANSFDNSNNITNAKGIDKESRINQEETSDEFSLRFQSYIDARETFISIEKGLIIQEEILNEVKLLKEKLEKKYMMLVNNENTMDDEYVPSNLTRANIKIKLNDNANLLDEEVGKSVEKMFNDAKKEGINLNAVSGYRSYPTQERLYRANSSKYVAKPGTSEHQTGYAVDILSDEYPSLTPEFDETKEFEWLENNCYKYGFILRYPKDKEDITEIYYEPWHYRYIGDKKIAEEIMKSNLTLEEYLDNIKTKIRELEEKIAK